MTHPQDEPLRGTSEEGHRVQMPPGRPRRPRSSTVSGGTPGEQAGGPSREGPPHALREPPARSDGAKSGIVEEDEETR